MKDKVKIIKDPEKWDVQGLEEFFSKTILPEAEIQIYPGARIVDIKQFVTSHLDIVKANTQVLTYRPYYDRLITLKLML